MAQSSIIDGFEPWLKVLFFEGLSHGSKFNTPWRIGSIRPSGSSWIEGNFLPSIQHLQLDRRQLFPLYSASVSFHS